MALPQGMGPRATGVVVAAFGLAALAAVVVLGTRAASVVGEPGRLLATSGGESASIYNVVKIQQGLPLYEDPRDPPYYPTTLYNAGFYHAYALLTRAFAADPARLVIALRFVTLGLGCLGLAAILSFGLGGLDGSARNGTTVVLIATVALATAFGPLPGWWLLSTRPDIGAAALGALALAIVCRQRPGPEWVDGLAAGVCLAAAWTFKQSCVLTLAGLVAAALTRRRFRFLAGLMLPPLATVAAFALLLGPAYRYNTVVATSFSGFELANLTHIGGRMVLKGAFPLLAAVLGLSALLPRHGSGPTPAPRWSGAGGRRSWADS